MTRLRLTTINHAVIESMANSFGRRLATVRGTKSMSQADLAKRTKLKPCAISHFETGRRRPSWANAILLAIALDVSLDDFVVTYWDNP